jgi:hypothetical protein
MTNSGWLVQRYEPGSGWRNGRWADVLPPEHDFGRHPQWPASDAGDAFRLAVINNPTERLTSVSYRVLPYVGGATFNVAVNVEGTEHAQN